MNFIDIRDVKVYYINLDRSVDRKSSMETMLNNNNFSNYERISAVEAKNRVGCSMSHIKALEYAIKKGEYPYIILEDDVEVYNKNFIVPLPEDSDAIYLGLSSHGSYLNAENNCKKIINIKNKNKNIHQVVNMLDRHAIMHTNIEYDIDSIKYNKKFLKDSKKYLAGDVAISILNQTKTVYALNNPIFYQNDLINIKSTKKDINKIKHIII